MRSLVLLCIVALIVLGSAYLMLMPNLITGDALIADMKLGLDLQGGTHVVLEAQGTPTNPVTDESVAQALEIIRFRVDKLGVSEPIIQRQGDRRIIVELAGVQDPEEAVNLIGKTAMLEFRDEAGKVVISGNDLVRATATFNPYNQPVIHVELSPEARRHFAAATTANVGRVIFIVLDDEVVQSPVVKQGGIEEPEITGYESLHEAQQIAMLLNSGALPVPLTVVENRIVSATLGQDSIDKSMMAAMVGIAAVALFMIGMYRGPGAVATVALMIYGLILLGLLIGIRAVLTLPGIAGIILSIGMAVDANVIVFERIKDELLSGKTIRSSIEGGFDRALRTIIDANVTTLIGASVLFYFGAGPIRGFAVTLSLGILVSMATAIFVTRFLLRHAHRSRLIANKTAFIREAGVQ